MPELPEVDAIAGVARKYAAGSMICKIEIIRWNGKYFASPNGPAIEPTRTDPWLVSDVYRVGKQIAISILPHWKPMNPVHLIVHNAMTGYFDWEHEPWTFDYVEGEREAGDTDVRVKFHFTDGNILRFHDARLFGSMSFNSLPKTPELMTTPNGMPGRHVMSLEEFYQGLQSSRTPIKVRLMDQEFFGGIGNIYSAEALHVAGIHPSTPSRFLSPEEASVLHASLVWTVDHSIPQVRYDWLNVYRRTTCGTCDGPVKRIKLGGRATFFCPECQPE